VPWPDLPQPPGGASPRAASPQAGPWDAYRQRGQPAGATPGKLLAPRRAGPRPDVDRPRRRGPRR
jgi:hypothetical protein